MGLVTALSFVRGGHRSTILDRFDMLVPTGSRLMIQPTGLAVPRSLGPAEPPVGQVARIERLYGNAWARRA